MFEKLRKQKRDYAQNEQWDQVDTWIQNEAGNHHPAFNIPSTYDQKERRYISDEEAWMKHLAQLIRNHDEDATRPPDDPLISGCSWEMIFTILDHAKEADSSRTHLGKRASIGLELVTGALDAVPDDYGLSVVKGVLGLVFQTAKRQINTRKKILDAFETLPGNIYSIRTACGSMVSDSECQRLWERFMSTVVEGMPVLIEILLGEQRWHQKVKNLITLGQHKEMKVDDIILEWKQVIDDFQQQIRLMVIKMTSAIQHQGLKTKEMVGTVETKLDNVQSTLSLALDAMISLKRQKAYDTKAQIDSYVHWSPIKSDAMSLLYQDFHVRLRQLEIEHTEPRTVRSPALVPNQLSYTPAINNIPMMDQAELLGMLGVSPDSLWIDLDAALQESCKYRPWMLGRVWWLLQDDGFHEWFQTPDSAILLVEADLDTNQAASPTPTSVFNSTLISTLIARPSFLVMFFFAGLHSDRESELNGPCGMMRNLMAQIFFSTKLQHPDLRFMDEDRAQSCDDNDIKALCSLFEELIRQLPTDIQVLCILDGLVVYEDDPQWSLEMEHVIAMFEYLAELDYLEIPAFKVFMAFSHHSLQTAYRLRDLPVAHLVSLAAGNISSTF